MVPSLGAQSAGRKHNLLYILVDQLSGMALPGMDANTRMPNTARLMESGVTFSHAYSAGMTCGPSRASLHTGLFTQTHGVGGGFQLSPETPSLPDILMRNGYTISHPDGYSLEDERAMHEKWLVELGYDQPSSIYGSEDIAQYLDLPLKWKCGRAGVAPEHGFDTFCAQSALRFIEENRDRPFACFLQLRGPHDPYMVPRPYDTLVNPASLAVPPYRDGEFANKPQRQREAFESQGASKMTDTQIRQILAVYYGMAAYSDVGIGLVMKRLAELGLHENTVVAMVSDHGDTMGRHRFMSKDFAFYEPAVRIPMILRAPGMSESVVNTDPVSGIDLLPTLCDLMNLEKPAGVAGQSLVGRWEGLESDPQRVVFSAQGRPGVNRAVMARTPEFKFTHYDDGDDYELYDERRDPDELFNVADSPEYTEVRASLEKLLTDWERKYPHRV